MNDLLSSASSETMTKTVISTTAWQRHSGVYCSRFNGRFPREPGSSEPMFIEAKNDGGGGDNWS